MLIVVRRPRYHRAPPSLPTRRSSDLVAAESAQHHTEIVETHRVGRAQPQAAMAGLLGFAQASERRERAARTLARSRRSEEHTSELQSRRDLVCRLLLEKKKKT